MGKLSAKVTSKNQVTLPADLMRSLGVQAGDTLRLEIDDRGVITVSPPTITERLEPWIGYLRRDGSARTRPERDAFLRDMRGDIDE